MTPAPRAPKVTATWDSVDEVGYIRLPRRAGAFVANTEEVRSTVLVDLDIKGRLLGVEILLGARKSPSSRRRGSKVARRQPRRGGR